MSISVRLPKLVFIDMAGHRSSMSRQGRKVNGHSSIGSQSGSALILAMLVLLVLTVIGISGASQAILQERMAGNTKQQTDALFYAESGIVWALSGNGSGDASFVADADNWAGAESCNISPDSEDHDWSSGFSGEIEFGAGTFSVSLACEQGRLFLTSIGSAGDSTSREIRARIADLEDEGSGFGLSALTIAGGLETDRDGDWAGSMPRSRNFEATGGDGERPAVTFSSEQSYNLILDDLLDAERLENYDGGLAHGDLGYPFQDPNDLAEFVDALRDAAKLLENAGGPGAYHDGQGCGNYCDADDIGLTEDGDPQISFVDGDFRLSGSDGGSGVLVVTGDLWLNGTPNFDGLILAVGEEFRHSGAGGESGKITGSLFVGNLLEDPDPENEGDYIYGTSDVDPAEIDFSGGGDTLYEYDQDSIMAGLDLLEQAESDWEIDEEFGRGGRREGGTIIRPGQEIYQALNWHQLR